MNLTNGALSLTLPIISGALKGVLLRVVSMTPNLSVEPRVHHQEFFARLRGERKQFVDFFYWHRMREVNGNYPVSGTGNLL